MNTNRPVLDFLGLGLSEKVLDFLNRCNFKIPTPIQHQSIPVGLDGKDLIGVAQTGTGKTLAFGLPMIQRLALGKGQGLILLPTRELALQVNEALLKVAKMHGISTAVLIGGESMNRQFDALRRHPRIIIATPGRLLDHMERGTARLNDVKILVLDEADRMLDMGFAPQINQILRAVPKDRQTLLYSATMPHTIVNIASSHMKFPIKVEVAPSGTAAEKVEHEIIFLNKESKQKQLEDVLKEYLGTALVFARTRRGANKICRNLNASGFRAAEIHSDRSLRQRIEALEGFKRGRYRILVATDIASRGIDVENIEVVINYDLPDDSGDYVHRIGRTGRAGREGKAISFATPDQKRDIRDIEALMRKPLKVTSKLSAAQTLLMNAPKPNSSRYARRWGGSGRQGPRHRMR